MLNSVYENMAETKCKGHEFLLANLVCNPLMKVNIICMMMMSQWVSSYFYLFDHDVLDIMRLQTALLTVKMKGEYQRTIKNNAICYLSLYLIICENWWEQLTTMFDYLLSYISYITAAFFISLTCQAPHRFTFISCNAKS